MTEAQARAAGLTEEEIAALKLNSGAHSDPSSGHCLLEVVSMFAGEDFGDSPKCVDYVLASFGRACWKGDSPGRQCPRLENSHEQDGAGKRSRWWRQRIDSRPDGLPPRHMAVLGRDGDQRRADRKQHERSGAMSKSEYELARRLLVIDRGASEAEDARDRAAAAPLPALTSEQIAGMDDAADFAAGVVA